MSKNVLVISPIPTHPRNAGHRERIYQLMRAMQQLGHDVHLLHITLEPGGDLEAMQTCWGDRFHIFHHASDRTLNHCAPSFHTTLTGRLIRRVSFFLGKTLDFPYGVDDWYDPACETMIAELHRQFSFDVVCAEYVFCSKTLSLFDTQTLKILDTHDVFGNRKKLFQQHGQQPLWFYTTPREERKALRRADVILAIQEHECRFFQKLVPEKHVVTIGHFVELRPLPMKTGHPLTLLFLASANQINMHGFHWFLQEVWPCVQSQQPDVRMLLAGSICSVIDDHPSVTKSGEFQDAKSVYEQADVVISPILFGTGLKIKNVEAMGYAKPLVTTSAGAEGLEQGIQTAFFAAATAKEFANRILDLLTNSELRYRTCQQAYCFAEKLQQLNRSTLDQVLQIEHNQCQHH